MTAPLVAAASTYAIQQQAQQTSSTSDQAQAATTAYMAQNAQLPSGFYDSEQVTAWATDLARISDSFSIVAARQSDGFMADAIANLTGKRYREIGTEARTKKGVREGVTTAGVFGRTADTYRYQQSLLDKQFITDVAENAATPTELVSAIEAATDRAGRAAQMQVALAIRNQSVATMAQAARKGLITGYRRVLHAELDKTGSCGLCIADSTRVYRSDHLMAMHPGCHCVPVPISPNHDPGAIINDEDLGRFYGDAGGTSAARLRATRYKVDEHGEIGPVLRPFGDPIRTKKQADRDRNKPRRPKTSAEQAATLRNRRDQLAAALGKKAGETDPAWRARMDAVQDRIAQLEQQIVKVGG